MNKGLILQLILKKKVPNLQIMTKYLTFLPLLGKNDPLSGTTLDFVLCQIFM